MTLPLRDDMCEMVLERCGLGGAVPWVLMASLAYYHGDGTMELLSDGYFDKLCTRLLDNWVFVEHRHKPLIREDDLRAGSLNALSIANYPMTVRAALLSLVGRQGRHEGLLAQWDTVSFVPPEWAMDTLVYGLDDNGRPLTWKEYRAYRREEVRENIARVREAQPEPPAKPVRVRQRPAAPLPPPPPPTAVRVRARPVQRTENP